MIFIFVNGLTKKQEEYFSDGWTPIIKINPNISFDKCIPIIKDWMNGSLSVTREIKIIRNPEDVNIKEKSFKIKSPNFETIHEIGE